MYVCEIEILIFKNLNNFKLSIQTALFFFIQRNIFLSPLLHDEIHLILVVN